nr:MAG TPA: hypothetical protein [Caudoviricetes sp.]DAH97092.1 MAG TPA: hypothetical protein [Caudoviricetes sp.]
MPSVSLQSSRGRFFLLVLHLAPVPVLPVSAPVIRSTEISVYYILFHVSRRDTARRR